MRIPKRKSENYKRKTPDFYITKNKFDELKINLEKLKKVSQPNAIKEVQRLAQEGDFSENVPYQMAKGRLRGINNRIEKLEDQINKAEIISLDAKSDRIEIGHTVTVEVNGKTKVFQILGSTETDPTGGVISRHSPLGQALLGGKAGDIIETKLANKVVNYKIIKFH